MDTKQILKRFEQVAMTYLNELERYTYEQLLFKPAPYSWSLGELYNHLIGAGLIQLEALRKCQGSKAKTDQGKTWIGKLVYLLGTIPPVKARMPASVEHTPYQPASKEEIRMRLMDFIEQMRSVEPLAASIPTDHKVKQSYFGYINAQEWYHHILMHFQHHLRQKKRMDKLLASMLA